MTDDLVTRARALAEVVPLYPEPVMDGIADMLMELADALEAARAAHDTTFTAYLDAKHLCGELAEALRDMHSLANSDPGGFMQEECDAMDDAAAVLARYDERKNTG